MSTDKQVKTEKKPSPFAAPAGKTPVLLVPTAQHVVYTAYELLEKDLGTELELPKVVNQLRVQNLTKDLAVFTLIAYPTRTTRPTGPGGGGNQPTAWVYKITGPIDTTGYGVANAVDSLDSVAVLTPDYGPLIDRFQAGISPHFSCRLGEDGLLTLVQN